MIAPTLTTARLTLRMHTAADFAPYADLFMSDRAKYMGKTADRKAAWNLFCSDVAEWTFFGHGYWAIDLTETGAFMGQVGFAKRSHFPEVELGWFLFEEYGGKGYAEEAAIAARSWAYDNLGLDSLVSYIEPGNTRSIALAERLGAHQDAAATPPAKDVLVYRHPASEARR
ncbi:MAG: GNAT family N-acetyltransferase [Pseudomonadota bacterium]